jgi:hypothetical protein
MAELRAKLETAVLTLADDDYVTIPDRDGMSPLGGIMPTGIDPRDEALKTNGHPPMGDLTKALAF